MFHLLVAYQGWPDGVGTISSDRIYIKPDQELGSTFFKNDKLDITQISKVPALLMTEIGGRGNQIARLAYINRISQNSGNTTIQYTDDASIRPIDNEALESFLAQLGINKFSLSHTHWEICDADTFKILLVNQQKTAITPKVFSIDPIQQDANLVSVMMPFKAEFNSVYTAIQAAIGSLGLKGVRADNIWEHHVVIQDIVNIIARAKVVICDCSGKNPNVFYEAGIAHTLGKEVILIAQSEDDVPFDLRHLRYIRYLPNTEGLNKLSDAIKLRLASVTSMK